MKKDLRAVLKVVILTISFVCATAVLFVLLANQEVCAKQNVRTVNYEASTYFDEEFIEQFDDFEFVQNDNDLNITATKTFSTAIFDEIDLVADDEETDFTIRYEIEYLSDDETILLNAYIVGEETEELTDTIPGLVSYNEKGEADVLFNVDEEYIWLSELNDGLNVNEAGWLKKLVKKVAAKAKQVVQTVATAVKKAVDTVIDATQAAVNKLIAACAPIIRPLVEVSLKLAYKILGEELAAKWGAALLMMYEDPKVKGVFHSDFDCWQQYFGYIDVYDTVFKASTSMDKREYEFSVGGNDYKFWAWKGDYLNLGTGCELGIYKRWNYGSSVWKVDKSLAVPMTCKLKHHSTTILDWNPGLYDGKTVKLLGGLVSSKITTKQWWITAFNSNYKKDGHATTKNFEKELTATFDVDLSKASYYDAFLKTFNSANAATKNKEIRINEKTKKVTIEF